MCHRRGSNNPREHQGQPEQDRQPTAYRVTQHSNPPHDVCNACLAQESSRVVDLQMNSGVQNGPRADSWRNSPVRDRDAGGSDDPRRHRECLTCKLLDRQGSACASSALTNHRSWWRVDPLRPKSRNCASHLGREGASAVFRCAVVGPTGAAGPRPRRLVTHRRRADAPGRCCTDWPFAL